MSERKFYNSFSEMPFGANYSNTYEYNSGFKFSKLEIIQIIISVVVLTIAFSFVFAPYPALANLPEVISNIPIAFLGIVTAFFCHELAHKYMGQKYGYWSEFRMFPMGLLLALFFALATGFLIAAPGAVQIFGRPTKEETGKISVAGPLVNIIISTAFTLIWLISSGWLAQISFFIALINAVLATFNLIPFGIFDGWKIFSWKKEVWVLMITVSLSTVAFLSMA
jgi:Zn-dependent protease